MSDQDIRIRLSLDGADQVQSGAARAAGGLQQLGQNAARAGQQTQLSGQQMAQVSAQLQDLFVQIQGGQAPLTALVQQGSQLSAVFGGTGNALRAVASLVTPAVAALGGVAAAVGGTAAAYAAGSAEADAYRKAIVLSGNAAGVTVGQLQDMARAQAALISTQSRASEVLTVLAASGNVARAQLAGAADAAIRLERAGGPAAEETAKKFAKLGEDPVKALVELNKAENFLTESLYRQVKALQDQGRTAEAAALAQSGYAAETSQRAQALAANLGTLERAWISVKDVAKAAWDAMLGIGREDTLQQRIQRSSNAIAEAQAKLEAARAGQARLPGLDTDRIAAAQERRVQSLQAELRYLQVLDAQQRRAAAAERERAAAVKATIEAEQDAVKGAREAAAALERQNAATEKAIGLSGSYSKDLRELVDLRTKGRLSEEQYLAAVRKLITEQPVVREQMQAEKKAHDDAAKAIEAHYKAYEQQLLAARKSGDAVAEQVLRLQDEEQALRLSAAGNGSLAQAIQLVAIARLQERQAKSQDMGEVDALQREIDKRRELIDLIGGKEAREANKRAAEDLGREWQRATADIERSLTDSLMRGGKNAAEYLRDLFRTLVLRPVLQPVAQLGATAITSLLGLPSSAAASGQGGLGGLGNLGSLGSLLNGASIMSGGSTSLANLLQLGGQLGLTGNIGTGYSTALQLFQAGQYGGAGATALGTTAGTFGPALLGRMLGQQLSGGYSAFGSSGSSAINAGTAIGAIIGGPIGAGIGATIGGAINRAFGTKPKETTASGLTGTIGGGDFSGQTFADWIKKGGWFRSDKRGTDFGAVDAQLADALDLGASALLANTTAWAKALQLPADQLAAITTSFRVTLTGKQQEDEAAIAKLLTDYGGALTANLAGVVAPFSKAGETAGATLERLATSLVGVNEVLALLGQTAITANAAGGDAAAQLLEAFGSLQNLQTLSAQYYGEYYTEAERTAAATRALTATLGQVGISLPASRDAYRQLVEAQDLNTEAGRKAYAVLLQMAPAFAQLVPALSGVSEAAAEAARLAQEAAQRQAEAGQRVLQDLAGEGGRLQVALLRAQGQELKAAALERQQALAGLTAGLGSVDAAAAAAAYDLNVALQAQIDQTLAAARATQDAAQAQAQQQAQAQAAARAILQERAGLEQELLRLQGDSAELRRRELEALDPSNRALQAQINALRDAQDATAAADRLAQEQARAMQQAADEQQRAAQQLRDAWTGVGRTLLEEAARLRGLDGTGAITVAQARAQFAVATGQARAGSQDAARSLPELARVVAEQVGMSATSRIEVERARAQLAASLEATAGVLSGAYGLSLPRSAAGAGVPTAEGVADLVRQAIAPSPLPATGSGAAADPTQAEILAELRSLRAQVVELQASAARSASAGERTRDVLVNVTENGRAMQTEVAS